MRSARRRLPCRRNRPSAKRRRRARRRWRESANRSLNAAAGSTAPSMRRCCSRQVTGRSSAVRCVVFAAVTGLPPACRVDERLAYRSVRFRKFSSSAWPCSDRIDSGWNCTPHSGRVSCSTAMIRSSSGPGRDPQPGGQGRHRQQRVIAHGAERRRHALEQAGARMVDVADAAMHRDRRPLHAAAKSVADALVTQAYAEDRAAAPPGSVGRRRRSRYPRSACRDRGKERRCRSPAASTRPTTIRRCARPAVRSRSPKPADGKRCR